LHGHAADGPRANLQNARAGSGFERCWPERSPETTGALLVRGMRASLSIDNQGLLLDRFREI